MFERILYASLIDVSLPTGPGVNERVFLRDMIERFGNKFRAVIPGVSGHMPEELVGLDPFFIRTGASVRSPIGWSLARIKGSFLLPSAIKSFEPHLIVMRVGALALPQFLAARTENAPYVLKTAGDVSFDAFYSANMLRKSLKPLNEMFFHKILHGALCIDVVSDAQRDRAINLHPTLAGKVHVIDNGVDLHHFSPTDSSPVRHRFGFGSEDIVVGYVGSYPMDRGGKEVIDAVANLRPQTSVKGLIVGDTGQADACAEYARSRGVDDAVVVYGEVDYSAVPGLIAAMDIGLSILRPKERGASEQKVRQYLAMGLCVVGTAGSNDFLRGKAFSRVIPSHEVETVVSAVAEFARKGRTGLGELGKAARTFAIDSLSYRAQNQKRVQIWKDLWESSETSASPINS